MGLAALCCLALLVPGAQALPSAHVYASPGGADLKAYVFTPPGGQTSEPRPAIVVFHGGGWAEGDAEWAYPRARHFAERGMVAVAAQYRLSNGTDVTPIEAMADARAIIRWMRAEAATLGIDPNRIAAYGWSAGAHLAASAALFDDDGASVSNRPDALVLASPAVSIDADSWFQELLGDRASAKELSPDEHVRAGMPPTVIVQGDVDTVTPLAGVRGFCDRMRAAGNTCELHVFEGFGHLFTPAGVRDDRQPAPDRATAAAATARIDAFLESMGFQSSVSTAVVAPSSVEQTAMGTRPAATLVTSFDGLGVGFEGPHGNPLGRNPSDNSLAVGPDHVFQIVNSRFAIFDKQGRTIHGSAPTNTLFKGFGGTCEERNNGDAVVRYDQLANRWLVVMPIFRRAKERTDQPPVWTAREEAWIAPPGVPGQPGAAMRLFVPPPAPPEPEPAAATGGGGAPSAPAALRQLPPDEKGPYSMCYAVSTSADPLGTWHRYEFLRPLFPDYPRPAIWTDGYYVPTSTGDDVIQKHVCIVEREKMLKGEPAREQCLVIDGVNFLNNADLHGTRLPPADAPNIMMAAGGTQLKQDLDDDGVYVWKVDVDWDDASKTRAAGPAKIAVAPYEYLCGGQLTNCVPQPGTDRGLDAQGDKIMSQLVYRNLGDRQSIVAVHSVNTSAGGGGVRWYEFGVDTPRGVSLRQQGTYAPDAFYRWMASPAIDKLGNIGIGYSFGGTPHFAGQRFAARLADDPLGQLTMQENVLVEGEAAQVSTLRWEDYTQTAIDPSDDCTIWYVGDYLRSGATTYSTRIGAFRLPGCQSR